MELVVLAAWRVLHEPGAFGPRLSSRRLPMRRPLPFEGELLLHGSSPRHIYGIALF